MNNAITGIAISTAIIVIAVLSYLASQTYMKNAAIESCMNSATVKTTLEQGTQIQTFTMPDSTWYEKCKKDKGLK